MKKIVVGLGILAVFIAYSLWVRQEQPTLTRPLSLTNTGGASTSSTNNSGTSANTNSSTSTMGNNSSMGSTSMMGHYKDGTYTGSTEDAYYGNVQVSATVSGGKLSDVNFLQYPDSHDTSVMINQQAMPYLKQEAIQAQSAQVQVISGATFTSQAFIQSLTNALSSARA